MPANPSLPTTIVGGVTTGRVASAVTAHTILNGIYKYPQSGTTKTGNYTLAQSDTGGIVVVNSASTVTITVPSLEVGTDIAIWRYGAGAINLSASGVTFRIPPGSTANPRVQYSKLYLWWFSTTEVSVDGDLA